MSSLGSQDDITKSMNATFLDLLKDARNKNYISSSILDKKTVLVEISKSITSSPAFATYEKIATCDPLKKLSDDEIKSKKKAYRVLLKMLKSLVDEHALNDDNAFNETDSGYLDLLFLTYQ
jgi:hypothetical protein